MSRRDCHPTNVGCVRNVPGEQAGPKGNWSEDRHPVVVGRSLSIQPGGKCGPKATQDEHQERGNHLGTLQMVDYGVGASQCTNPRWLGWSKKPRPRVMPGICRLGPRWME